MSMIDLEDEPDHLMQARHLLVKLHYFVIHMGVTEYYSGCVGHTDAGFESRGIPDINSVLP